MQNENNQVGFAPRIEYQDPAESQDQPPKPLLNQESHGGVLTKWDDASRMVRHNLSMADQADRALLSQCREAAEKNIRNVVGSVWPIVAYYAHVVELADEESGELRNAVRLVMVTRRGVRISTVSKPVIEGFAAICNFLPNTRWNPPLLLRFSEHKGRSGHTYCTCCEMLDTPETRKMLAEPLEDDEPTATTPKKKGA